MLFQTPKTLATLKSYRTSVLQTSNIYHTSIPTRLFRGSNVPLNREFQSTVTAWNAIPKPIQPESEFNRFELNGLTAKAIHEDFGYTTMSTVQEAVLTNLISDKSRDLLVRAKTGTGKTLAFMIAALEQALDVEHKFGRDRIPILVMSPTRELAIQIGKETEKLVKHHRLRVEVMVGGTNRTKSVQNLVHSKVDIIVATPGRLNDVLTNEPRVRQKLEGLEVMVFDEADQLLEMGFKKEIESIVSNLPSNRSTLMFSATLNDQIKEIATSTLRKGYKFIDCVPKNEVETHMKIKQSYVIAPYKDQLYLLHEILRKHKETVPNSKVIVFLPTTATVTYVSKVLNGIQSMDVLQIHSKLDQRQRSRISDQFRRSRSSVLCTTDVSARGVDYPGVTLVLQLGLPSNREQYIHRIGRTGRAGKEGEAILVLSPYEERYLDAIRDLPVRKDLRFNLGPNKTASVQSSIQQAIERVDMDERRQVFGSILGFRIMN